MFYLIMPGKTLFLIIAKIYRFNKNSESEIFHVEEQNNLISP